MFVFVFSSADTVHKLANGYDFVVTSLSFVSLEARISGFQEVCPAQKETLFFLIRPRLSQVPFFVEFSHCLQRILLQLPPTVRHAVGLIGDSKLLLGHKCECECLSVSFSTF